jgi:hypothetical protein
MPEIFQTSLSLTLEIRYPEVSEDGKTSGGSKFSLSAIGFLKNQFLAD